MNLGVGSPVLSGSSRGHMAVWYVSARNHRETGGRIEGLLPCENEIRVDLLLADFAFVLIQRIEDAAYMEELEKFKTRHKNNAIAC
jgi:hypothetical protein